MKFSSENAIEKEVFGIKITEYCNPDNPFPIDCAVVHFRNNEYPCKINHNFYESFFVLEGQCSITFEDKKVIKLSKYDFFIIEPGKKHISKAEFADVMVCCNPPFDIKNIEFCKM